jgi:predicted RNA polymerase sigma factor
MLLERSATGPELTEYHIEAAIASMHARALRAEDMNWTVIVSLYDTLMTLRPSPVIALNRVIAVAQDEGPERGLEEIYSMADSDRLSAYPFYSAALGELEFRRGRREIACQHFHAALALARSPMERRFLDRRFGACANGGVEASGRSGTGRR